MYIRINEMCDCSNDCEGKDYFEFKLGKFKIHFFDDYGYKFIYVYWDMKFKRWQF
jgi:hypothetical protein